VAAQDLANLYAKNPQEIPMDEFMQEDRERMMELLLSQERVVTLLYAKAFPVKGKVGGVVLEGDGVPASGNDVDDGRPSTTGAKDTTTLPGIRTGAKSNLE
jgi:hypothetical protein